MTDIYLAVSILQGFQTVFGARSTSSRTGSGSFLSGVKATGA